MMASRPARLMAAAAREVCGAAVLIAVVDGYWLNIPGRGPRCPTCNSPRPDVGQAALRAVL